MEFVSMILAGGQGKRLFPLSDVVRPKQFVPLNGETLLESTFKRVYPFSDDIFIVTGKNQSSDVEECLKDCNPKSIIVEPMRRNTAPAILLGLTEIINKWGDCIIGVFPSDHYIEDQEGFARSMQEGIEIVKRTDKVVTFGVKPDQPSDQYGYMYGKSDGVVFIEKPSQETAVDLIEMGYQWNSGMFLFRAGKMLEMYREYANVMYLNMMTYQAHRNIPFPFMENSLSVVYREMISSQFDKKIIEKAEKELEIVSLQTGWSDLGTYERFLQRMEKDGQGNAYSADEEDVAIYADEVKDCVIVTDGTHYNELYEINVLGVEGLSIILRDGRLYIAPHHRMNEFKEDEE